MYANAALFPNGQPTVPVKLAAHGYSPDGSRSGGIKFDALPVVVPVGARLFRLFIKPGDFGEWWFTPHEFQRIADYLGVDGSILSQGRSGGLSALHGALALLSEWYGKSPDQISRFHMVKVGLPVMAMYGEGDVATTSGFDRTLKPMRLDGGKGARQLFLPRAWEYKLAFQLLTGAGEDTDSRLPGRVGSCRGQRLGFE